MYLIILILKQSNTWTVCEQSSRILSVRLLKIVSWVVSSRKVEIWNGGQVQCSYEETELVPYPYQGICPRSHVQ